MVMTTALDLLSKTQVRENQVSYAGLLINSLLPALVEHVYSHFTKPNSFEHYMFLEATESTLNQSLR